VGERSFAAERSLAARVCPSCCTNRWEREVERTTKADVASALLAPSLEDSVAFFFEQLNAMNDAIAPGCGEFGLNREWTHGGVFGTSMVKDGCMCLELL
jgi:hypothetical protein